MIDILKFQDGHFDFFVPILTDDIEQFGYHRMKRDFCEVSKKHGCDFRTLVYEDRVLAICGIIPISTWSGEVVAMFGIDAKFLALPIVRTLNAMMDRHQLFLKIHRLQMTTIVGWDILPRWARLLGFEYEGKLKAYGPNREDHLVYGRIR